jgi:ABC-type antimicrobial peptide transport system permease subunit
MAPLQKRALITFIIGLLLSIALIVVFLIAGDVTAFDHDVNLRYITYAALIGVPLTYLILIDLTLRKPTELDERDRLIIMKSGRVQWLAVIFSLATWMIVLTEVYRGEGQVPVVFLSLIFMSILIVSILAQSLGILLGYWRSE